MMGRALISAFLCSLVFGVGLSALSLDAHHMVQYKDTSHPSGASYGSQRWDFSYIGSTNPDRKHVTIITCTELLTKDLDSIIKNSGALLVIVDGIDEWTDSELARWNELEYALAHMNVSIPIYFSQDHQSLDVHNALLKSESGSSWFSSMYAPSLRLTTTSTLPTFRASPTLVIEGWLRGGQRTRSSKDAIAVVAHLDSFTIAPGLSFGADANGSGVAALLEILRAFSSLYAEQRTRGAHDILFLITTGGSTGFEASREWLREKEQEGALRAIEFVLCLDAIGKGDALHMYSSKPTSAAPISKVFQYFSDASRNQGIDIHSVHKKINISDPTVYWEHEQYSRRRVPAASLTHRAQSPRMFERSNVFDTISTVDDGILFRNVKVISEALAKLVYDGMNDYQVFEGSNALNEEFLKAWFEAISESPRFPNRLGRDVRLVSVLHQVFETYAADIKLREYRGGSAIAFAEGDEVEISVYQVRPASFYTATLGLIIIYLVCIYVGLVGVRKTMKDVKGAIF